MARQKLGGAITGNGTGQDGSALASAHEKVIDARSATAADGQPWRGRAARVAAAGTAGILAVTGAAGTASAATPASSSWHIVKSMRGESHEFTAITTAGRNGGWAFAGQDKPVAYERSGSAWTKVPFVSTNGNWVIAAGGTSRSDAWAFTSGWRSRSTAVHWNGHRWSVSKTFPGQLTSAVVISGSDIWAFGGSAFDEASAGTWHYNGRSWSRVTSGKGLQGGSGLSASDAWAYDGTNVAHWNGHTWTRTSVTSLLPPKGEFSGPGVTAIYAQSKNSVWAVGNGNTQDVGGPMVVLHYDGHGWKRVAYSAKFGGYGGPIAPDGKGGLWIPMPGSSGGPSYLVHYSGGKLTAASLPVSKNRIGVQDVVAVPHSSTALADGWIHAPRNPGSHVVAVLLQYGI